MDWTLFFNLAVSLLTLTILELVLGVDNLIFIAIMSSRLPAERQKFARRMGLILAMVMRLILLAGAYWIVHLLTPLFTIANFAVSGRDLFLVIGGIFLLYKSTQEIHNEFEIEHENSVKKISKQEWSVVLQIAFLDIIFSLDSVLTAVGMTNNFWIMATAIILAILGMLFASEPLSRFVQRYPTVRMLAFSFLLMVGMILIADGLHFHVPRGYVYFAVAFSIFVEIMNILRRKKK